MSGFMFLALLFFFGTNCSAQAQADKYFEMGASIGAPAFWNGVLGYWSGPVGLRLSGMYFGKRVNGIQVNLGYRLSEDNRKSQCLGIAIASSQDRGCDWSYLALVYDFYNDRFFVEIGLAKVLEVRRGDFSSTPYLPIFQIGYLRRF